MSPSLSFATLAVIGCVVLTLALAAPLYTLLLAALLLVLLPGQWEVAGIQFDPTDLALAALFIGLLVRGKPTGGLRERIPHLGLWLGLGLVLSVAYLHAEPNRQYLTDPVRIAYQLYRYCWKGILFYPLAILLLTDRSRVWRALLAMVIAADFLGLDAIFQGYQGLRARGPFGSPNALGAALLVPLLISIAGVLTPLPRWQRVFLGASGLWITRALLFSGSRGAYAGAFVGIAFLVWQTARLPTGRRRLLRLAPAALLAVLVVLATKPGLGQRPNVQRMLTVTDPLAEETLQWRLNERWPHFWRKVTEHPWLGIGTDVDPSLGPYAHTPHSGYLSLAVTSGVMVPILYLVLALLAIAGAARRSREGGETPGEVIRLAAGAGLLATLVHNVVDSTLLISFVANTFWILVGVGTVLRPAAVTAVDAQRSAQPVRV